MKDEAITYKRNNTLHYWEEEIHRSWKMSIIENSKNQMAIQLRLVSTFSFGCIYPSTAV